MKKNGRGQLFHVTLTFIGALIGHPFSLVAVATPLKCSAQDRGISISMQEGLLVQQDKCW